MILELATPDNFDAERYAAANPDVAEAVKLGMSAREHFEKHGIYEGRKQFGPPAEPLPLSVLQERFRRFESILDPRAGGEGKAFAFIEHEASFPVSFGGEAYDVGEYDGESANHGFAPFIEEIRANPDKLYLDVGCGLRSSIEPNCLYLEVYRSRSADIVMEPDCRYPIASNSLDGIGCFAVLEHVEEPWKVAAEFRRMLKPGGKVFIDWPFLQPVHGYPSHYYNATREGLRRMFSDGWAVESCDTLHNQGPDYTISWTLNELLAALPEAERARVKSLTVAELAAQPPGGDLWRDVLAGLPAKTFETLACGNSLVAAKV
ncbi:methyltransferase domain-containing protein [Sphingomonas sp.]|uniref:methyltransferase domain-containing protein n=1 Tax=Sphingomonas sp. TaxID=28214 RepID=UPI002FDAA9F0